MNFPKTLIESTVHFIIHLRFNISYMVLKLQSIVQYKIKNIYIYNAAVVLRHRIYEEIGTFPPLAYSEYYKL